MRGKIRWVAGGLLGAVAGYAWYATVGCMSGTCPISSNPLISSLYGAGVGLLMATLGRQAPGRK